MSRSPLDLALTVNPEHSTSDTAYVIRVLAAWHSEPYWPAAVESDAECLRLSVPATRGIRRWLRAVDDSLALSPLLEAHLARPPIESHADAPPALVDAFAEGQAHELAANMLVSFERQLSDVAHRPLLLTASGGYVREVSASQAANLLAYAGVVAGYPPYTTQRIGAIAQQVAAPSGQTRLVHVNELLPTHAAKAARADLIEHKQVAVALALYPLVLTRLPELSGRLVPLRMSLMSYLELCAATTDVTITALTAAQRFALNVALTSRAAWRRVGLATADRVAMWLLRRGFRAVRTRRSLVRRYFATAHQLVSRWFAYARRPTDVNPLLSRGDWRALRGAV